MEEPDDQDGLKRRMVKATLLGHHTHSSTAGINVHCWQRDGRYLARGRFEGRQFGETIGKTECEAEIGLRHLLTALDEGSFLPPSRARTMPVVTKTPPCLRLDELAARFLEEKRQLKGERTMQTYRSRLEPVLLFASSPEHRKRWPYAHSIDRGFAIECRGYLHAAQTTRNGKPGAVPHNYSSRQIYNVLETIRSLINWAIRPQIRLLSPAFINPFGRDLVGSRGEKDPLRGEVLPLDLRVRLAAKLDCWQLGSLGLALALPLRPEELTSILISDVDLDRHELHFGTRLNGGDFTKGRQCFTLPIPEELESFIISCIGDRSEGPLLCRRTIWQGNRLPRKWVSSPDELASLYETALSKAGSKARTEQDRKDVFHQVLRQLGGLSTDELRAEFKAIAAELGLHNRLYDLRHAVTTDMHRAGVRQLELRYMTGHTTKDILNEYVPLDIQGEMKKYTQFAKPLFKAMRARGYELGCLVA